MTITIENIEQAKVREQQANNWLTSSLRQNLIPATSDDEKSIIRKIDALTSFKEYFLQNIDSAKMNDNELISYMLFIESITDQIQAYEIMIGRIDIESLRRAGQNLARKQRISMGIID